MLDRIGRIVLDDRLKSVDSRVYVYLITKYGVGDSFRVHNENLAKKLRVSNSTIKRSVSRLFQEGYIDIETVTLLHEERGIERSREIVVL